MTDNQRVKSWIDRCAALYRVLSSVGDARRWLLVIGLAISSALPAVAQDHSNRQYEVSAAGAWSRDIAGPSVSAFGWTASVRQYPYIRYPWIGGAFAAGGLFDSHTVVAGDYTLSHSTFSYLGGPTFRAREHAGLKPFGEILLGTVVESANLTGPNAALYSRSLTVHNKASLGSAIGGGVDYPLRPRLLARGEADWVSFKDSGTDRVNDLRVSTGVVMKF